MTVAAQRHDEQDGHPSWPELLSAACAGHGVTAVFQPIVDLARGSTVGFEALARFSAAPDLRPDEWFAAARAHGCGPDLESVALRTALEGRATLSSNAFLSVNVSPDVLTSPQVRAVWHDAGDLSGVVVELTEQAPIESYAALDGDLAALRAAGAIIAVDDAGAGYAGLTHLLSLRPAIIKLDRELVRDLDVDEAKRALVEMIGTFAGRIDSWLLAEGIEREGELDTLASLGVPLGQGFLLARPGPRWPELNPDAVLRLVSRSPARRGSTVLQLIETVPTVSSLERAAELFANDHTHTVVVVDQAGRPVSVYTPNLDLLGITEPGMRLNFGTPVVDALTRAMTRDVSRRYEPAMCTDNAGRFLGVVRIERMIQAVVGELADRQ